MPLVSCPCRLRLASGIHIWDAHVCVILKRFFFSVGLLSITGQAAQKPQLPIIPFSRGPQIGQEMAWIPAQQVSPVQPFWRIWAPIPLILLRWSSTALLQRTCTRVYWLNENSLEVVGDGVLDSQPSGQKRDKCCCTSSNWQGMTKNGQCGVGSTVKRSAACRCCQVPQ